MSDKIFNDQYLFLETVAKKAFKGAYYMDMENVLLEKRLSGLLLEEVTDEEKKMLADLVQSAQKDLDNLIGELPNEMSNTKSYFTDLRGELPPHGEIAKIEIAGNEKEAAKVLGQATTALDKTNTGRKSFYDALLKIADNVQNLNYVKNADDIKLKQSLETIAQKDEADRDDFPDEKTFRQGVEKTYLPPKPREGFFGKIADFFKMGHLGATTLADDVLKLPLKTILDLATVVRDNHKDAIGDVGESAPLAADMADDVETLHTGKPPEDGGETPAKEVEVDMAAAAKEEGIPPEEIAVAEKEAEEAAKDIGKGPVTKGDLTMLLKKFPEIVGQGPKATRQRRSFRKAINHAAGKEIFEEGAPLNIENLSLIMEMLIDTSHQKPTDDLQWTNDELTQFRWMRIAGLEED
jgi:hypothetical protein